MNLKVLQVAGVFDFDGLWPSAFYLTLSSHTKLTLCKDTLIALRSLMPLFTFVASESILGAVLERLNSPGAACHKETIGDYTSFINIQNDMPSLGDFYYKYDIFFFITEC